MTTPDKRLEEIQRLTDVIAGICFSVGKGLNSNELREIYNQLIQYHKALLAEKEEEIVRALEYRKMGEYETRFVGFDGVKYQWEVDKMSFNHALNHAITIIKEQLKR